MTNKLEEMAERLRPKLIDYQRQIDAIPVSAESVPALVGIAENFARDMIEVPMIGRRTPEGPKFGPPEFRDYAMTAYNLGEKYLRSFALYSMNAALGAYAKIAEAQGMTSDTGPCGPLCMLVMANDELEEKLK